MAVTLKKWDNDFMSRHKFRLFRIISCISYQYGTIKNRKARRNRLNGNLEVRYALEVLSFPTMELVLFEPSWMPCNKNAEKEFVADKKYWL
jgi:hypothetical protein